MDTKFKFRTIVYIVVTLVVLSVTSITCHFLGIERILDGFTDINYFDLLTGQVANTLIVLSLTSVLSSNFGQVYWVDIKDTKLISPFWGCFIGITVYLLTGLIYSVASYAIEFKSGIVISAVGSTVLLVILTFKMISIYFGKDELKKQLKVEYQKKLILNNTSYVTDYLRRLKIFQESIKNDDFQKKKRFLAKLSKEIKEIELELNSRNEERIDRCHKEHIAKYIKGKEEVQTIDLKIEEYTKNAISNNDTEVVMENIALLIDAESYDTFFNLLEELFEWDEKYACKILRLISKKNKAWLIKDKMSFFKQYALQKLISQSGKLDAIQNLLLIYDPTNLGMSKLMPSIKAITEQSNEIKKQRLELDNELTKVKRENYRACMKIQCEARTNLKNKDTKLGQDLQDILKKITPKDIRAYYVPIQEAHLAYNEGKYEIVNKYLTVILTNFEQDCFMIKSELGFTNIAMPIEYVFSYITDEEKLLIDQLIEKDMGIMAIPEATKIKLSKLNRVVINNNVWSGISTDTLEIYRSTLDL